MDEFKQIMLKNLEIQWLDHFHMRDQTWKILQYSILFFLGVIALKFKEGMDNSIMRIAYIVMIFVSATGIIVTFHHRRRQKEKFEIIMRYEKKIGILNIIDNTLKQSKKDIIGKSNTFSFIVAAQASMFVISAALLILSL